jgi:glycosyltransferase involved in cell wall biosynthesis
MIYDGYGSMSQYLALGLARAGVAVDVIPFGYDPAGFPPEFVRLVASARPVAGAPTLVHASPLQDLAAIPRTEDLFFYTMWESSRLPTGWRELLSRCRAVFVPTAFARRVFVEGGVRAPVIVVPLGVDPALYQWQRRPERPGLHTLTVGTFVPRKNIDIGLAAWKQAFAGDPDARLTIKTRFRQRAFRDDDPRIRFVDKEERTHGIADYYRDADVLLALGNEGFGLPLLEGMATGLPVIALDSEGQSDVCQAVPDLLLPVPPGRWVDTGIPLPNCGVRAEPSVADVADRLRWVADHRAEARAIGERASVWVRRHRNVWDAGPRLLEHMEGLLATPRRLRAEGPARVTEQPASQH